MHTSILKKNTALAAEPNQQQLKHMLVNTVFFMPLHFINGYNESQCIIRKLVELLCKQHALHGPMCVLCALLKVFL